eukprot:jgi/Tetstr1/425350/TSEL_015799.t1
MASVVNFMSFAMGLTGVSCRVRDVHVDDHNITLQRLHCCHPANAAPVPSEAAEEVSSCQVRQPLPPTLLPTLTRAAAAPRSTDLWVPADLEWQAQAYLPTFPNRDGHDSADKKHEIAAPHYSPAASPLIPALFDEASAVGGGAQLSPLSGPGTPVDGFEASAARGVVGAWVSPSAPPQVTHYLQSLLTGATPPPPSVELVRAAAARDPRTGLCRWETWITPAAPAAAQEGLSAWLLGRAAPPTLPSPSPWSIGSARAAQGGRPLHEAWRATHSPAKSIGSPAVTEPSSPSTARSAASSVASFSFAPQQHGIREWVADSSKASTAVKSSVINWAESAAGPPPRYDSLPATSFSPRHPPPAQWPVHDQLPTTRKPFAPASGPLGSIVGAPGVPVGKYVSSELETALVTALLPLAAARLTQPRLVGLWGASGAGKTCAASAAVRTPSVRRCFPGGIVWIDADLVPQTRFDASVVLLAAAAAGVDSLPSNGPAWPPLNMARQLEMPSSAAHSTAMTDSELRAWLALRVGALPGHCLFVVDSMERLGQAPLGGLAGLGASLLMIGESAGAFFSRESPYSGISCRPKGPPMPAEVCANGGMSDRQAVAMLLAAAGCRLDSVSREAAAALVSVSSKLPAELLLLAGVAKRRASVKQLPCRASDLRALTAELRGRHSVPPDAYAAALRRSFQLAISELTPLDETMLLRLGATWPEVEPFTFQLLHALWFGGSGSLPSSEEVALLAGRLEQCHIFHCSSGYDNAKGGWQMTLALRQHIASRLREDGAAHADAEARLLAFRRKTSAEATTVVARSPSEATQFIGTTEATGGDSGKDEMTTSLRFPELAPPPFHASYPETPSLLLGADLPTSAASYQRPVQIDSRDATNATLYPAVPPSPMRMSNESNDGRLDTLGVESSTRPAAYYSDRGELLEAMEETLRSRVGESAVAMLPPSPSKVDMDDGEQLHYHYHYHSSAASSAASSPARRALPSPSVFNLSRFSSPSTSPVKWPLSTPASPIPAPPSEWQSHAYGSPPSGSPLFYASDVVPLSEQPSGLDLDAGMPDGAVTRRGNSIGSPVTSQPADAAAEAGPGMSLATQRMLEVHITPYLPVWDKLGGKSGGLAAGGRGRDAVAGV